MSNENNDTKTTNEENTTPKKSASDQLVHDYKDRLKNSGEEVRGRFLNLLVERELDDRVKLLDSAFKQAEEVNKEIKKLSKPDTRLCNTKGEVVLEGLSEKRTGELAQAQKKLKDLNTGIDAATATPSDFTKLREMVGNTKKDKE